MPKLRELIYSLTRGLPFVKSDHNPRLRRFHSSTRRNIRDILRNAERLNRPVAIDQDELAAHLRKWSVLQRRVGDQWYRTYALTSGRQTRDYIPEDIFYSVVDPLLNNIRSVPFLKNKGLYELIWGHEPFPRTIVRNLSGFDYDASFALVDESRLIDLLAAESKVVVKPSLHSGGGRSVRIFSRTSGRLESSRGEVLTPAFLKQHCPNDHIVQEFIQQHDYFSRLNGTSLNTFRVLTYRSVVTDEAVVLGQVIRMGAKGAEVDNETVGGMSIHIHPDGAVSPNAVDKMGTTFDRSPSGVLFRDLLLVPCVEELRRAAIGVASKLVEQRLLGVDLCLERDGGVRVIEINFANIAVNFHQMSGHAMFGPFTDEVIEYCRARL